MKDIKKNTLISQLDKCRDGEITAHDLQEWMILNFDPTETKVGVDEAGYTIEAMNIVMNEYELVNLEKISERSFVLAIEFIRSNENDHRSARAKFLQDGFTD